MSQKEPQVSKESRPWDQAMGHTLRMAHEKVVGSHLPRSTYPLAPASQSWTGGGPLP